MEAISGALCFEPWKCLHGGGSVPCVGHGVGMRTFISAGLWYYSKAAIGSTKTMVQIQHVLLVYILYLQQNKNSPRLAIDTCLLI